LYLEPEQTPENICVLKANSLVNEKEASGKKACVVLKFGSGTKTVCLRYGISLIDTDRVRKNLNREIQDYDLKSLQ